MRHELSLKKALQLKQLTAPKLRWCASILPWQTSQVDQAVPAATAAALGLCGPVGGLGGGGGGGPMELIMVYEQRSL